MPAAWERIRASCSARRRSGGIDTVASAPNPVEMPYFGAPSASCSTTARAARHPVDRLGGEFDGLGVAGDVDDVVDRDAGAVELDGHDVSPLRWCASSWASCVDGGGERRS